MNYQERIHDFLDGMLDAAEEADLLRLAADNPDIREELRHAMILKNAFKADTQALTPPPELTQRIFSELRNSTISVPQVSKQQASNYALSGSGNHTVLTAVVSSFVTAFILLFLNNAILQNTDIPSFASNPVKYDRWQQNALQPSYLRVSPVPNAILAHNSGGSPRRVYQANMFAKRHYSTSSSEVIPSSELAQENILKTSNDAAFKEIAFKEIAFKEIAVKETEPASLFVAEKPSIQERSTSTLLSKVQQELVHKEAIRQDSIPQDSWLSRVQIHARRIVSTSLPPTDFPSNPSSFLRNTALGAMFKLSEQHSIGIELSEETYYQNFQERSLETGSIRSIQQNPSLLWVGINYRYLLLDKPVYGFTPFLQGLVGGTQLGATGRMMVGLNYSPDAKTEFTLGLEGSSLLYLYQGVLYASPKLGFSYGVSLKL